VGKDQPKSEPTEVNQPNPTEQADQAAASTAALQEQGGGDKGKALHQERERRRNAERELREMRERLAERMPVAAPAAAEDPLKGKEAGEYLEVGEVKALLAEQNRQILAGLRAERERQEKVGQLETTIEQYDVFSRTDDAGDLARAAVERALMAAAPDADLDAIIAEVARKAESALVKGEGAAPGNKNHRPAPTPSPTPGAAEAATMRTPTEHPNGVSLAQLTKEARAKAAGVMERVQAKLRAGGQ
jgi:hypothetical protein